MNIKVVSLMSTLMLVGCQTSTTISVEEAKKVVAEFTDSYSTLPPRSVEFVLDDWKDDIATKPVKCLDIDLNGMSYEETRDITSGMAPFDASQTFRVQAYRHFLRGRVDTAVRLSEAAVKFLPDRWKAEQGYANSDVAFFQANVGDLTAAKIAMGRAYAREFSNEGWRAYGHFRQLRGEGAVARLEGEEINALAFYLRAIEEAKTPGAGRGTTMHREIFGVISEIVDIYRSRGDLQNAESIALESLRRNAPRNYITWPENSILLSRFAQVLFDRGRYDEAIAAAKLSTRLFDLGCIQSDSLFYSKSLMVIGKSLVAKSDYEGALAVFDKIYTGLSNLPEPQQKLINSDLSIGIAFLFTGQAQKAKDVFTLAHSSLRDSANKTEYGEAEIVAFHSLGDYKLGNIGPAFLGLKKALPLLLNNSWERTADDTAFTARDRRLSVIVNTYLDMLVTQQAEAHANNIDPVAESFLITQAVRGKRMERTFAASVARANVADSELAKLVRGEQDAGKRRHQLQTQLIAALSNSEDKDQIKRVNATKKLLEATSKAQIALRSEIIKRFPDYAELINPKPISITDAKNSLGSDEALIVTYTATDKSYIWAVPADGDAVFSAANIGEKTLSETVTSIRRALEPQISSLGDIPPFDTAASHNLYTKILMPVEAGWKSAKTLHVVAHGALGSLPLSVLVTEPVVLTPNQNLLFAENRNIPWLARNHAIAMLPSVSALKTLGDGKSKVMATQPFVGFGDPYFSQGQALAAAKEDTIQLASATTSRGASLALRSKPRTRAVDSANLALLPRLPETRWEVESIAKSMGVDPAAVTYTGLRANEQQVKTMDLAPYRVISFATHGLVPGDLDGLVQPALALTAPLVAGVEGDGLLTVDEILNLKLNADWAVLSACNTAAADGAGSEAVSGLGRAFFYAGARALLVSNWPVHSGATAKLMTTLFYLQAADRKLARSKALQQTRLELIDNGVQKDAKGQPVFSYAHPIFWAPFTLVGDGGTSKIGS